MVRIKNSTLSMKAPTVINSLRWECLWNVKERKKHKIEGNKRFINSPAPK